MMEQKTVFVSDDDIPWDTVEECEAHEAEQAQVNQVKAFLGVLNVRQSVFATQIINRWEDFKAGNEVEPMPVKVKPKAKKEKAAPASE